MSKPTPLNGNTGACDDVGVTTDAPGANEAADALAMPGVSPLVLPAPASLVLRDRTFDASRPAVMAIINRTPDSFYQGNRHADLGGALAARGWFHDRQTPPDTLHSTVSNTNTGVIDEYLEALAASVAEVRGRHTDDRSTNYATLE